MQALIDLIPPQAENQTIRNPLRTLISRFHPLGLLPGRRVGPLGLEAGIKKMGFRAAF